MSRDLNGASNLELRTTYISRMDEAERDTARLFRINRTIHELIRDRVRLTGSSERQCEAYKLTAKPFS